MRTTSLLSLCAAISFSISLPAAALSLEQQRSLFTQTKAELAKGKTSLFQQNKNALSSYPLYTYLVYDELSLRLKSAPDQEIEHYISSNQDLPQIRWMQMRWLKQLADKKDWATFAKYYSPELNFTELDCLQGQQLLATNQFDSAYSLANTLWLSGQSQPNACDPLFNAWAAAGKQTEEHRWQRFLLAIDANNYRLANYLTQTIPSHKAQANKLLAVAQRPELIAQTQNYPGKDSQTAQVVALGLRKLARKNAEQALTLLNHYSQQLAFTEHEQIALAKTIGLPLAKRFDIRGLAVMQNFDPNYKDDTVSEWKARLLLRTGQWKAANQTIRAFPSSLANTNRWQYWQARSLQLANPSDKGIQQHFANVANQRDFYGFLSADQVKQPYHLLNQPKTLSPEITDKVRNLPAVARAKEFIARNEIAEARREWYFISQHLSNDELIAQAKLAYEMQWYFPAIVNISRAQYWDDLDIRFPLVYQQQFRDNAKQRGLLTSWVIAITRQESGFMADAKSHAGAMGLMQVMPATARETARRYGITLSHPQKALEPETNIQIGTAYLSQVSNMFKGNRILASAAYNAGPGRVRQWLKDADHLPYDVWVESIPFDETRQYVQNVLTYSVIYSDKLKVPAQMIQLHEQDLRQ
ncbi:transglycosylase SLT domain-containing protein [Pseudomonas sp. F1_0610]|uniref:transglycosylase SLT domain-containing protein n=1 Tax=Pseudomonas sp. F1_0610 TaxID=3114284 RepID=UPI0039C14A1C